MGKRTYIRSGGAWVDVTTGAGISRSASAPSSPVNGQVYYNTTDSNTYIYNGTTWDVLNSTSSSATPLAIAASPAVGTSVIASRQDHVHEGVTSITGTANQVIASAADGAVTLSLPQSIATTSTPTFGATTINGILTSNQSGTLDLIEGIILQRTTSLSISTTSLNTAPTTGNTQAISWSSAVKANTSMWTSGSAIVAPLAGWYAINLNFQFGTGTSYAVAGYIFQGSTLRAHEEKQAGANTAADMLKVSAIIYCAANDSITARVAASTTSKSITVTSQNGYFSMLYLGAQS